MKKVLIGIIILIAAYGLVRWGYGEASYVYFEHKCETDAGEFIYKTVENVEGLYQMRPRDPRDYFTRLRAGDIPEDPYGHTNAESQMPAALFLSFPISVVPKKVSYKYFESQKAPNSDRRFPKLQYLQKPIITGDKYWIYTLYGRDENGREIFIAKQSATLMSKYGYTWQEIRGEWDKFFGVWGGELVVKELKNEEILGIKRGYFYVNKFTKKIRMCPKDKTDMMTYDFISQVLKPIEDTGGKEK